MTLSRVHGVGLMEAGEPVLTARPLPLLTGGKSKKCLRFIRVLSSQARKTPLPRHGISNKPSLVPLIN